MDYERIADLDLKKEGVCWSHCAVICGYMWMDGWVRFMRRHRYIYTHEHAFLRLLMAACMHVHAPRLH